MVRSAVCLFLAALFCSGMVDADDRWIGRTFMPKVPCVPAVDGKAVSRGVVSTPLVPSKVDGEFLWVGRAWVRKGEVIPLEDAVEYYTKLLESDPKSGRILDYRAAAKVLLGNLEGAREDRNHAIKVDPHAPGAYASRAIDSAAQGKLDAALSDIGTALQLDPRNPAFLATRANIHNQRKEWDDALAAASEAIQLDPGSFTAFHERGYAWQLGKQKWEKALADYDEAIRLNPESFASYSNRALIRAAAPDERVRSGKQALSDAMRTCEATQWKIPKTVRTLAAAYAELQQFEEARKWQLRAIEIAGDNQQLLVEFREQLAGYEDEKPLRLQSPVGETQSGKSDFSR